MSPKFLSISKLQCVHFRKVSCVSGFFLSFHMDGANQSGNLFYISALPFKMTVLHSYNLLRVLGQQDGLDPRSLRSDHEDFLISDIYEICGLMLWWTFDVFYYF